MKELYDQASEVACYYRAYSSYGGNARTAVRALRGRMPAKTAHDCEVAFQRALLLFDRCKALMDADQTSSPQLRPAKRSREIRRDPELPEVSHLIPQARPDFPEFSDDTIETTLNFVLLYYHLR